MRGCIRVLLVGVLLHAASARGVGCTGDCDGNGSVTVDELLKGVNIALDNVPLTDCPSFDRNGDGAVTVDELLEAVNAALNSCPATPTVTPMATATASPAPTPIFPADYRSTFTEVRDCRFSIEHGGVNIRVLANAVAAQSYLNNANPLPVGSIVVKEEFNGTGCNDADFVRWRAMRKEAPGFDARDGDWRWQWVERDGSVLFNDKSTCIGCHARPACLARDHMCTVGGPPHVAFQLVFNRLPAALLSIAGRSASDVYTVGADPGDGFGPFVLHYDGQRWRRLNTHVTGAALWWISVTPVDGKFYMAGEHGVILRFDPATGSFEPQTTPGTPTLFGVWGSSANNVLAVGGDPNNEQHGGVVWRFDGATWSAEDLSRIDPQGIPTLFKVWGRNAADVYAVGRDGIVLHYDGSGWLRLTSNTTSPLFTVHGNDTLVAISGGDFQGEILEDAGGGFSNHAQAGMPQMNGVFLPPNGNGVAVGVGAAVAFRSTSDWQLQDTGLNTSRDFHATWIDPDGGIWAVGGDLSVALAQGILAFGGSRTIGSEIIPLALCPPATPGGPTTVSYFNEVLPLWDTAGCTSASCHGGPFPSSGYDMRSYDASFGPGVEAKSVHACEIVPGNPATSFLLDKFQPTPQIGARMPSNRPALTAAEVELIRTWILEGAQNDAPNTPTPTVTATPTRTPTPRPSPSGSVGISPTRTFTPTVSLTPNVACQQAGVICTVAGTGSAQFDGDGKPAVLTSLYYPLGVTFDQNGRPLMLDWNNLRVRRINTDGTVTTIMGTDVEAFPTDGALAVDTPLHHASDIKFDGAWNLYVAGDHVPVVFRVNSSDTRVFIVAGTSDSGYDGDGGPALQAKLTAPFGVLPTSTGGFFISDLDTNVVRYVDAHGTIATVAGTGVAGYAGDSGPGVVAKLAGPARMQIGPDGALYFCETKNHVIRRLSSAGIITTYAGTGTRGYAGDNGAAAQAQFDTPYDLRFSPRGDLYIADTGNNVIRRIAADGMVTTVVGTGAGGFAGDGGDAKHCRLNHPSGVTFDADGSMWIADTFNERIRRVANFLSAVP